MPTPTVIVIFGITGDLSRRKLLPALFALFINKQIEPRYTKIVGITRRDIAVADLLPGLEGESQQFADMISLFRMDLTNQADYRRLRQYVHGLMTGDVQYLHYLSMPPQVFAPVIKNLGAGGLNTTRHRILVEKPFGYDLESAQELIACVQAQYDEDQVYRIDHYLAKETAQNILTFRFSNPLFMAIWNAQNIDRVIITAAESIDIEGRGSFYEQTGAMRDLIQSHLLQLMALVGMEEPARMTAANIHRQKLKLLRSVIPIAPDKVDTMSARAQYKGYRQDAGSPHSTTETFAAIKLFIDNPRWHGVPFVLQSGKALSKKSTQVTLVFKDKSTQRPTDNHLVIKLQPNEGIGLTILAKKPGLSNRTQEVEMDFRYHEEFAADHHPEAYERVLTDAIRGDNTLFATSDEVLASWRIIENVMHQWTNNDKSLKTYNKGAKIKTLHTLL